MIHVHPRNKSFVDVAMAIILVGVFIMAYGAVSWLWNYFSNAYVNSFPGFKVIGGLVVMCLGYVILELDLIREKR